MGSKSTKTLKKTLTNGTMTLIMWSKETKREVIKLSKERKTEPNAYIEREKKDSEELIEILEKIPAERKGEVLGIVKGFALCAETVG